MKLFISAFFTSVAFAQGRNLQTSGTTTDLETKWAIDENPTSVYTASSNKFVMTYASVADILTVDDNMQVTFYDKNCKNPVAIEGSSTPTMYSLTEGMGIKTVDATPTDQDVLPTPLKLGNGMGAELEFLLDPETLANNNNIYSILENGNGEMELCFRFGLGYWEQGSEDTPTPNVFQEVNFVESVISITYDLTAGFDVAGFNVSPKEQDVATATLTYQVKAYLCVPGSEADGVAYPDALITATTTFNQGTAVEVCVRPDDAALGDGIVMDAITDFEWKREDVSPSIEQDAIVGSEEATNGLTTYTCVSESKYCHFSSILFADFYKSTGTVGGSGKANLKFSPPVTCSFEFPEVATEEFMHGLCVLGASSAKASSNSPALTYIGGGGDSGPEYIFQNDVTMWGDRDFVAHQVYGKGPELCEGGLYLQPSKVIAIPIGTSITLEANPVAGSDSVTMCALIEPGANRHGNWPASLTEKEFIESEGNFELSINNHIVKGYCKTLSQCSITTGGEQDVRALQGDDEKYAAAAADSPSPSASVPLGQNLKGDDERRRKLQDDAITTVATTTTIASSPFDVSVGVTKADDGPGALKTAGGDASSIVGYTALASVVALTGAAALLA